jgi:hypothetical protein
MHHIRDFRPVTGFKYPLRKSATTAKMLKMSVFLLGNRRQVMLTSYHSILLSSWLSTMLNVSGHEAQKKPQTYIVGLSLGHQYL